MALTVADFCYGVYEENTVSTFLVMAVELAGTLAEKLGFIKK